MVLNETLDQINKAIEAAVWSTTINETGAFCMVIRLARSAAAVPTRRVRMIGHQLRGKLPSARLAFIAYAWP